MSGEQREIRLLIADDKVAARAGIREALAGEGFTTVAETASAADTVELALLERPHICLIGMEIPGGGITAAREITGQLAGTIVVMLSVKADEEQFLAALRAGALGYLLMNTKPARLSHALRGTLAGEPAFPRRLIPRLVDEFRTQGRRRTVAAQDGGMAEVTGREWEVLQLLHSGLTTAQVAERLWVSPVTVRRHIAEAIKKLGVADRESAFQLLAKNAR
jgi:DNA-binding NarL/FixJ family response regulator